MKNQNLIYCIGHGVGQIQGTEEQTIGDKVLTFIKAKILSNGMILSLPQENKTKKYRNLIKKSDVNKIYSFLKETDYKPDLSTWNRRQRDYISRIQDLDVFKVASVLRDLNIIEKFKKLSFGEMKTREKVVNLLAAEIQLVSAQNIKEIKEQLLQ